jgi:hypothetical protein
MDFHTQNKSMVILTNAANLLSQKNRTFNGSKDSRILSMRRDEVQIGSDKTTIE